MLSFVIPAHNEEQHLGATLAAIGVAAREIGEPFEMIVADDASTDQTSLIAEHSGARVIRVQNRQIAATRNAGARAAKGDVLFFVDADTLANATAVRACLDELRRGAIGGGCVFRFDGELPAWARVLYPLAVVLSRSLKLVGGCFLFCKREAFEDFGGFDERYFAGEEILFIAALKRRGRFAVPRPTVVTSGRKLRAHSFWQIIGEAWRWALRGPKAYQRRDGLDIWYGARAADDHGPSSMNAPVADAASVGAGADPK
ncbi:MAG TPA: glycosyltransferase [Pirellulales bacterium]|jgi:glycosyltransferase involved in cell wall biosynthesis|nr:glycosyltransferase [Pirellulales bacterium]